VQTKIALGFGSRRANGVPPESAAEEDAAIDQGRLCGRDL
jgi:hypothetical protein